MIAFFLCLLMAYISEHFFGVSDITGAFVAGLILSASKKTPFLLSKFDSLSFLLLSPVFFASVGLKVTIDHITVHILLLSAALLLTAIITKIIGCYVGARLCRYTRLQSVKIGIGMVSRGEVALIVASKGAALGLMPDVFFAPLIIVVVATTIITPIMLKLIYKYQASIEVPVASPILERHQEKDALEIITQEAVNRKSGN